MVDRTITNREVAADSRDEVRVSTLELFFGIAHPGDPLALARALALGGGVASFLVGDALFRSALDIGELRWRLAAAPLALGTIPLGTGCPRSLSSRRSWPCCWRV